MDPIKIPTVIQDNNMWRRIKIYPFYSHFSGQDPKIIKTENFDDENDEGNE